MQKKVLAAVIGGLLAAPAAFADSANVTISGRFQAGIENYELSCATCTDGMRVSDQSSRIIFSGSEDIGGGLKGLFQLDSRFSTDVASLSGGSFAGTSLWASGNTHVGLGSDSWGSVKVGRQDLQYLEFLPIELYRAGSLQNYQQAGLMAQVAGVNSMIATRTPNVVFWDSPNWGGITARLAYSTHAGLVPGPGTNGALLGLGSPNEGSEGAATGPDGEAINAAVRYQSGPLRAGVSLWTRDPEGGAAAVSALNPEQDSLRIYGGWQFPFGLKVGLGFDRSEVAVAAGATVERDAFMVPLTFTAGVHNFYLTYAMADDVEIAGTSVSDSGATSTVIGWDMALSKRTQVGAYYTKLDNDVNVAYNLFSTASNGAASATAGVDVTQIYLGIGHSF